MNAYVRVRSLHVNSLHAVVFVARPLELYRVDEKGTRVLGKMTGKTGGIGGGRNGPTSSSHRPVIRGPRTHTLRTLSTPHTAAQCVGALVRRVLG